MTKKNFSRRAFLAATTTSALALPAWAAKPNTAKVVPRKISPNETLNCAGIGVGGKGFSDIMNLRKQNVVALCDVDTSRAEEAMYKLKVDKVYQDYRKMLEEVKGIDAVTVSTPDHTHAPAAYMAMKMGIHVYVQKPLTHTVAEARLLRDTARKMGVATQMGNQGHSAKGVRQVCEMIWSGAIGNVREAHVWTDRPGGRWPQGVAEMPAGLPVPETVDWDAWIGSAPMRPYHTEYHPHRWRGWVDFGCGGLGDMACHIMDPAFWALKLGDAKVFTAETTLIEGRNSQTFPNEAIVKFSFPARSDMPPVDVYWYENGRRPERPKDVPEDQEIGDGKNGSLFVGDKCYLTAGEYGGRPRLLPEDRMADYTMPDELIPRVGNPYRNWLEAAKGGIPACSNFDYSGPFTEMVLLGSLAMRTARKLEYDVEAMKITNDEEANGMITKPYRKGWELPV